PVDQLKDEPDCPDAAGECRFHQGAGDTLGVGLRFGLPCRGRPWRILAFRVPKNAHQDVPHAFLLHCLIHASSTLCPSVPLSLCPFVPLSLCPAVPLSRCPSVPLSLCPSVPLSRCPVVPPFACAGRNFACSVSKSTNA